MQPGPRLAAVLWTILAVGLPTACAAPRPSGPLFTFGVVADIQYADKDTQGTRRYREAAGKLAECVAEWNREDLAFAVQLGDIVDGRSRIEDTLVDLDRVLGVLRGLRHPLHHVIGNHCLSVPRETLMARLGIDRAYYDFGVEGWRFVVLDGMDVNVQEPRPTPKAQRRVQEFLDAHPSARGRLSAVYNGGVGAEQLAWLRRTLDGADARGERAVVLCHLPTVAEAADAGLLLWNHEEIASVLAAHPCVRAYLCGHHHAGGHAVVDGVPHVTLQAMCDAPADGSAYALVGVFVDRLEIRGVGTVPSRSGLARAVR